MKDSSTRVLLLAAASCLLTATSSMGATLWVDGVLTTPTSHIAESTNPVTDQTNSTGWNGIVLEENETLTLTWATPFFNDGTGIIRVNSALRVFPDPTASGFDVRLLLSDGSYSDLMTISESTGVKTLDVQAKKYIAVQTIAIADLYSGPLAVKGIEFTNLNPDGAGGHDPFSLAGVNAVIPVPEPSAAALGLVGVLGLIRRRRP